MSDLSESSTDRCTDKGSPLAVGTEPWEAPTSSTVNGAVLGTESSKVPSSERVEHAGDAADRRVRQHEQRDP